MRDAFFATLADLGSEDDDVWALTGDLGIGLFDAFERSAPGRYLNVGIAEQNLVGVAAGLAYAGKKPFAYSIAPFLTSRPHDQIRVDVALARAPVVLVGVGGGVAYGTLGPTHHAIEDIALMRVLPNMTVLTPGDPEETRLATRAAHAHGGPVYLRLGKNGEPAVLPADTGFEIGRAVKVRNGGDLVLASAGCILPEALAAADTLAGHGVDAAVLHYGTVKPFDAETLLATVEGTAGVVTVEEHSILAGFGGAAAETLAGSGAGVPLARVGLGDEFASAVGSREHLLAHYALDAAAVVSAALAVLEGGARQASPPRTMRREAA